MSRDIMHANCFTKLTKDKVKRDWLTHKTILPKEDSKNYQNSITFFIRQQAYNKYHRVVAFIYTL